MFTREKHFVRAATELSGHRQNGFALPSGLYLVSAAEIRDLEHALSRGQIPVDFETKLSRLGKGDLLERLVEQNSQLLISLLMAAQPGQFKIVTRADCDRLLRVLAYVRKDDDAIPDYQSEGFRDDWQELRGVAAEMGPILQEFKQWRLRHQVPGIWLRADEQPRKPLAAAC